MCRIWDVATGRLLRSRSPDGSELTALALSPDGSLLALATTRLSIQVVDTRALATVADWPQPLKITSLAWTPDGRRLASASDDKTIRVWDPLRQRELVTLANHRGGVSCVAFDPSGQWLASGGWDGVVRLWDGRPMD